MRFLTFVFLSLLIHHSIMAGDWPQVLGPSRDGQAKDESVGAWVTPPTLRWSAPCGSGYAGVAVAREKVFLWHRETNEERLDCLSANDGRRLWRANFAATYRGGVDADLGPRCVPVVAGDQVYVYGAAGDLHCVSIADGTIRWTRELRADYEADDGYFGAGSTPIVVGNLVIATVGGRDSAGLVAVSTRDGKTQWKAVDENSAYASPISMQLNKRTYVVAVLGLTTVMIEPTSGEIIRKFDFGRRGPTVNAATPLARGSQLFMTASYGIGCRMLEMTSNPPADLWKANDVISSQYSTPVRIGNWLYAINGREDMGSADLLCANWDTGEVRWRQAGFGTAHLIAAKNRILAQTTEGHLHLLETAADEYRELAAFDLPEGTYRSLPAFASGVFYCRRTISSGTGQILAFELASE